PPTGRGPSKLVEVRQKFFGKGNVNPRTGAVRRDRVILSWFGVASYAAALNGHVVLIDAWVPRGSHSGYVPTDPREVAALEPEYIFIGHGDFDHAADAAEIAAITRAPIVGTPEHCDSIRSQEEAQGIELECIEAAPRDATPGFKRELKLIPGVKISAVTHIHSSVESPEFDRVPCPPLWNALDTVEHPPNPEDFQHLMRHLPDARGGNILYQFRIGKFALAWHDTTGKIDTDAPQVIRVLEGLAPTDVHFGAILAFGQVTNCMRSLRSYIDALDPTVFAATHHDNFTYFIGANAEDLEPLVRDELARIPEKDRPQLLYSYDREDYIKPELFTFDPYAPSWR
ncbi:MAG: MBL fold metallo-hydrolase, partial [Actinomycetota bacterium]